MATVRSIINRAWRMTHGHAENQALEGYQETDALEALNGMIDGLQSEGVGGQQGSQQVTGTVDVTSPVRLLIASTGAFTINLPKNAQEGLYDGFRVTFVDISGNFATNNITIDPKGMRIAGSSANLVLNTNNANDTYFFRADLGDWVKESTLIITDNSPYPNAFDEALSAMLAIRVSAENSDDIPPLTMTLAQNGLRRLQERYLNTNLVFDGSLTRPPSRFPGGYRTVIN